MPWWVSAVPVQVTIARGRLIRNGACWSGGYLTAESIDRVADATSKVDRRRETGTRPPSAGPELDRLSTIFVLGPDIGDVGGVSTHLAQMFSSSLSADFRLIHFLRAAGQAGEPVAAVVAGNLFAGTTCRGNRSASTEDHAHQQRTGPEGLLA